MDEADWYWCLDHSSVERAELCPAGSRLGPYASAAEAAAALEKVSQRNELWDNDDRWNDAEED